MTLIESWIVFIEHAHREMPLLRPIILAGAMVRQSHRFQSLQSNSCLACLAFITLNSFTMSG